MTKLLSALVALALLCTPGFAQDGKKPEGKNPDGKGQDGKHPDGKKDKGPKDGAVCGKSAHEVAEILKKKGGKEDVGQHFKAQHPDGVCHCLCGHDKPDAKGGDKPGAKEGGKDGGPKPPPKKEAGPCGRNSGQMAEALAAKGFKGDVDAHVADHFKAHPDGLCHCSCGHDKPEGGKKKDGAPSCGVTIKQAVNETDAKHFKTQHPDGVCHCLCEHEGKGEKGGKGNNGVGNGVDPQPPGKPPVNDGPGSSPGKPDRKK